MVIQDGCVLEDALICDGVVVGRNTTINKGVMLDRNVHVKENVTLESNTLASCMKMVTDEDGDNLHFELSQEVSSEFFEKGLICFMPLHLALA